MQRVRVPLSGRIIKTGAAAIGGLALQGAIVGSSWADGADIIRSWERDTGSISALDIEIGNVDGDGKIVTVTDFQVSVSLEEIANSISEIVGAKIDAQDQSSEMSYKFKFPSVTFTNLQDDGDRYTADAITADEMQMVANISIDENNSQITNATYSGFAASNLAWAKLPEVEANSSKPVSQFLPVLRAAIDFSFDELKFDNAVAKTTGPNGQNFDLSYGALRMGKTVRGDVSILEGGPVKMNLPIVDPDSDGPMQVMDMEIASFSATDYNYGTLLETLFSPTEGGDNPYRSVIDEMVMTDWKISVPDADIDVSIGNFVMADIGARNPTYDWVSFADEMSAKAIAGEAVEEPSEEEIVKLVAGVYGALSVGKFEISDIKFTAPEAGSGEIDAYGMQDLSADGLGSLYVRGVEFLGHKGEVFKYDESSISGVSFPDLVALMNLEENVKAKNTAEVIKAIPTVRSIVNSGIEMLVPEEDLDFSLGKSELLMKGHIGPVPTEIDIDIDNFVLPVDAMDDEARETFSAMGYERVDASYDMNLRWNEATQDLNITLDTELSQGGRLTGEASLGSIPRIVFEKPDESALFSLFATTFKNLNLRYDDSSLVDRGFEFAARQQGTDAANMKAQFQGLLPIMLSQVAIDPELTANVAAAVKGLIEDGKALKVSAVAATPLPVVALGTAMQSDPASILKSLQIEVGNN